MGDYFTKCRFTIAAVDASNPNQGCFRKRDPWSHQPCSMRMGLPNNGVVVAREKSNRRCNSWTAEEMDICFTLEIPWWIQNAKYPLDSRAWTMQEQLLAPRMLLYERFQLRFVCQSGEACENQPRIKDKKETWNSKPNWTKYLQEAAPTGNAISKSALLMDWYKTVEQYSTRAITKQSDILPAIGALASRFQSLTGDMYVAGLWAGDLHRGLLWTAEGPIQPGEQLFTAPSWSWASMNLTSIKFSQVPDTQQQPDRKDLFTIEDVTVSAASVNTYGAVKDGTLRVSGYLEELRLAPPSLLGKTYEYRKNRLHYSLMSSAVGEIFLDYPRMTTDPLTSVYCVPVLSSDKVARSSYWSTSAMNTICLAVLPVEQAGSETFRRVGLAQVSVRIGSHNSVPRRRTIILV